MKSRLKAVIALLGILVTADATNAQTFTGGLRGAVRDANGVIPGVVVTLTNESTQCRARDLHQRFR